MKVIDTSAEIRALIGDIRGKFNKPLWIAYAGKISAELPQKCMDDAMDYDFQADVVPVIERAIGDEDKLKEVFLSFSFAVENLQERFTQVFAVDLPVNVILYLGLCNGAGWATLLDGKPSILLGIEKIIELGWGDTKRMTSLLYHELGHIWHDYVGTFYNSAKSERAIWQLYQEGIAMYCEQLLAGDFLSYHQHKGDWLTWCQQNRKALFLEYKRRVDAQESTQDFFGDWCNYKGYSDVGYYLGCELIKSIADRYVLEELAKLDAKTVYSQLCKLAL